MDPLWKPEPQEWKGIAKEMSILYLRCLSSPSSSEMSGSPLRTKNSWSKTYKSQKGKRKSRLLFFFLHFHCEICTQRGESLWSLPAWAGQNIIIAQPNGNKFWHFKCHWSDNDHVKMLPHPQPTRPGQASCTPPNTAEEARRDARDAFQLSVSQYLCKEIIKSRLF